MTRWSCVTVECRCSGEKPYFYFHEDSRPEACPCQLLRHRLCSTNGKSFLGCIILNELMLYRGKPARFISLSRNFFHRLRDTFSEESERHGQAYEILDELVRVPYVVLDDLGVQRGTE